MSQVRIVTDSISDIPPALCEALEIEVVPTVVIIDGQTYRDKVEISPAEFYARLQSSDELPTTSQPPVGDFEAVYQRLARETDAIISIHLPQKMSGTVASAQAAAAGIANAKIAVVDAQQISMAQGWLTIMAARAAQAGQALDEILALIENAIPKLRLIAVLDTLEYVYRGGRIGRAEAMMGAVLRVKPIISIENGEVVPLENVRTLRRALDRMLELAGQWAPFEEAAVIHTAAPELAEQVKERLGERHPVDRIIVAEAGSVLGTHAGPGAVGIAGVIGSG